MSTFVNAAQAPAIGLSEEQAQLIDIAAGFCRDKSPVDQVRALLERATLNERSVGDDLPHGFAADGRSHVHGASQWPQVQSSQVKSVKSTRVTATAVGC